MACLHTTGQPIKVLPKSATYHRQLMCHIKMLLGVLSVIHDWIDSGLMRVRMLNLYRIDSEFDNHHDKRYERATLNGERHTTIRDNVMTKAKPITQQQAWQALNDTLTFGAYVPANVYINGAMKPEKLTHSAVFGPFKARIEALQWLSSNVSAVDVGKCDVITIVSKA